MKYAFFIGIVFMLFSSCGNGNKQSASSQAVRIDSVYKPQYAEGFQISYRSDGVRLLDIREPAKKNAPVEHFAFVPESSIVDSIPEDYTVITIPVKRVVCMTTPQLKGFSMLNAYDCVVATSDTKRMQDKEWLKRLADGRVSRIGIEGNFNSEIVMAKDPQVILVSPNRRGGYEVLSETGIPILPFWAFNETSALGLSEWIKVTGIMLNKEAEATSLFNKMAAEYNYWKEMAAKADKRPTIFSGEMRGGHWYVPGGQSFYARLFKDAGAKYFYENDTHTGGVLLDYETVYSKAYNAEFWRIMNGYVGEYSYNVIKATDERYADFLAFKKKQVIYCNLEYEPLYENMTAIPHVLLKDMIKAIHPEILPDYVPAYYKRLK